MHGVPHEMGRTKGLWIMIADTTQSVHVCDLKMRRTEGDGCRHSRASITERGAHASIATLKPAYQQKDMVPATLLEKT
jgi:hypothetical protein